jgi:hypothetical protein
MQAWESTTNVVGFAPSEFNAPAGTKAVYLAGEFNGWKPDDLKMDGPDASGTFERKQPPAATNISC